MDSTNRWELLATHARRTWEWMRKSSMHVIGFDVINLPT
jgi:hypothetical protein